jgi:hypothetical protein
VIRMSDAYAFRDPLPAPGGLESCKPENRTGALNQEVLSLEPAPPRDPDSPLQRALAQFGAAVATRNGIEQGDGW